MPPEKKPLLPGLYLVSTPIGNARDITLRALDVLAAADVLAAEDTRSLRRLMDIHGIALEGRPLLAYHDHNAPAVRPRLLSELREGRSVAYAPEAGTPLISDPGYGLVRAVIEAGLPLTAVPGPAALATALTLAGLPTDRFLFAGFLPNGSTARRKALAELAAVPATLVFYESPRRVGEMLADAVLTLGEERQAAICRELTKRYEEVRRGSLGELARELAEERLRGEVVVIIDRNRGQADAGELETALREALKTMSVKQAAGEVASRLGLPRRQVYQAALKLGEKP
ncbi:16S rRNA (cytidine1402-2'-O)-methyltransferase [Meinhardsimonia xiamenensis]|jgi:16S rRNA (cytidine1402-2'-O)-methyltransferase|uniref:Ribosomal RNA small subunit methyltransferase I n=1 Tax=Meinhardsimonia xiamenensis TaxID=990712 RepID=A0A1G8ZDY9_9RHOB|nr:16S rRNA (cytidine(1402)-2'-O)-methyltransferase [Meinhardsimonia xiamenensis]PRX37668.1 16S rRNA (cytidine1402-2'-O)-methyltransferase [Meinhardsimonia xiamenensis]SDK13271.1 16S rRNA (cytidine1402-2'-O)-methyltransferase [Meinhardsimonia xiamenensis]